MEQNEIYKLLSDKIKEDENKVVISFYELKIKRNLNKQDTFDALHTISEELIKSNYKVYRTNQKYTYNNREYIVESNELMIGIKNK